MHAAAAKRRIMPDQLMRYGCSYCREKRGLRQEEAILASIMFTLGTRCNAWRDCCAEIMTSKCCIEHLKRDGRKPGSGERCCSKNAMHVSGPPLLVLDCFHLILFILLIGKKYFENYACKKTFSSTCHGITKELSWQSLKAEWLYATVH